MREPPPAATRASVHPSLLPVPLTVPAGMVSSAARPVRTRPLPAGGTAHERPGGDDRDEIVLAFDFGTRRIGVAIGNTLTARARPLAIVETGDPWPRIEALIAQWQPARLVTGIARHPDGAAHEMTRRCERFARQLEGRFRLPVARVDERYSSAVAGGGRDDEAAAIILQQWLDSAARGAVAPPAGGEADSER